MSEVGVDIKDHVATITLDAPSRNALTPAIAEQLIAACDRVDADREVGAVVIRGVPTAFCSGAHRDVLAGAGTDPVEARAYATLGLIYRAFTRVGELQPPTVAAVRGSAVGAGMNLLLATDLRIVSSTARLISGFLPLGVHPGGGHFSLLGRLAGREVAAAMGLFGLELTGAQAAAHGLVWEAVADERVDGRAAELAAAVARDPELARAAARSLRIELGPPGLPWPAAVEAERGAQSWSLRRRFAPGPDATEEN